MNTQNNPFPEQQGFTTEDILWALGIWSVILSLSPVVVFYMLMVALFRFAPTSAVIASSESSSFGRSAIAPTPG